MPFMSDGPLYFIALRTFFMIPCEGSWYLNITLFSNILLWPRTYDKNTCFPYTGDGPPNLSVP